MAWRFLNDLLWRSGSLRWPQDETPILQHLSFLLDAVSLITVSRGDIQSLKLGDLANYGTDAVHKKVQSRLPDPTQFGPLMLELSIAAWHQGEGHSVTPLEVDSMPDLRIRGVALDLPTYIECKQLTSHSENAIRKHLKKANRQLRSTSEPSYGVAVFQFSGLARRRELSDETPKPILEIVGLVRRAMSGEKNRGVGTAIVTWDDFIVLGSPPEKTAVFLRRHHIRIDHTSSDTRRLPDAAKLFAGNTVALSIDWMPSLEAVKTLSVTEFAKECKKWFRISDTDVVEVFTRRERVQYLIEDGAVSEVLIATQIPWGEETTWVVGIASRSESTMTAQLLVRLPTSLNRKAELLSPIEMLQELAELYGIPLVAGGVERVFILREKFAVADDGMITRALSPTKHTAFQFLLAKAQPDGDGIVIECALGFALDLGVLQGSLGIVN